MSAFVVGIRLGAMLNVDRFGPDLESVVNAFVHLPCQIRTGRKLVYRLLAWNPYQPIFFRLVDVVALLRPVASEVGVWMLRSPKAS